MKTNKNNTLKKLLACVIISVCILSILIIPCSATWNSTTAEFDNYRTAIPITPKSFTFSAHTSRDDYFTVEPSLDYYIQTTSNQATAYIHYTPAYRNLGSSYVTPSTPISNYRFEPTSATIESASYSYVLYHYFEVYYNPITNIAAPIIGTYYDDNTYFRISANGSYIDNNGDTHDVSYSTVTPTANNNVIMPPLYTMLGLNYESDVYYINHIDVAILPVTYDSDNVVINNVDVSYTKTSIDYVPVNPNSEEYLTYIHQTTMYHTKYEQIVNSGSATSFVEFLTDTVGGFFGTQLFTFGNVPITIGAIISVFGAVAILTWLLKLFLGG